MMKLVGKSLALICLQVAFAGCLLVPALESYRKAGISEGDRQGLLNEQLKKFHDELYWNSPMLALKYVDEEQRTVVSKDLQRMVEGRRVIDSKVKNIEFSDTSYVAHVDMTIRSYKIPFYVVQDRVERELWKFSLSDGWKLHEILSNESQGKY